MTKKEGHHAHPLVKYIDEQLTNGYSEEIIKKHLKNFGHNLNTIERSFKIVKKTHFKLLTKIIIILCIIVSLFLLLWVTLSTNEKLIYVFIGFLPTILCLTISIIFAEKPKNRNLDFLWSLPFIFALLFLFIGHASNIDLLNRMEINKLTILNFIISFAFITMLYLTGSLQKEVIEIIPAKKTIKKPKKVKISGEKELKKYLQSIEDKCKAINFAIGRVYSNKKTGSKKLRDKIKINKVWYNEISSALKNGYDKNKDKTKILNNINKIKDRLELFHKTEKQVFGHEHNHLKNLKRDEQGNDKILHILIKNDKDPIKSYYDGALEFCKKIAKSL